MQKIGPFVVNLGIQVKVVFSSKVAVFWTLHQGPLARALILHKCVLL